MAPVMLTDGGGGDSYVDILYSPRGERVAVMLFFFFLSLLLLLLLFWCSEYVSLPFNNRLFLLSMF